MKNFFKLILFFSVFIFLINLNAATVSSVFSDNMVLQQGKPIPVWGNGKPGEVVTAELNSSSKSSTINSEGKWKIIFDEMNYGGLYELKIFSKEDTIKFSNVMIGEVWLCSGQSNMEMPVGGWGRVKNYLQEIAAAKYDSIRLLFIPPTLGPEPQKEVPNDGWKICSPENIDEFSAVAYFFGRELYEKLKVPIGLIDVTKGGTPIESWMSDESFKDFPEFNDRINFVKSSNKIQLDSIYRAYKKNYLLWLKDLEKKDAGFYKENHWFSTTDLSSWEKMNIPTVWENAGLPYYDGVVWFKKEITLPDDWLGQNLILSLGPIQDYDITFFNGTKIGEQKKRDNLSVYNVDKNLTEKKDCEITVRVFDAYGIGGIWGKPEMIYLKNEKGEKINLAGEWYYKPTFDINKENFLPPENPRLDRFPEILFNGMISPLIGFGIKGVLWYQGESNAERAFQYRKLFPIMIKSWRRCWKDDSLSFYFVQLANYKAKKDKPKDDSWAELREAQALALSLNNTGMAVTIDLGDAVNVHYKNKQEVGRRLALIALNKNYNSNVEYSGPVFDHFTN